MLTIRTPYNAKTGPPKAKPGLADRQIQQIGIGLRGRLLAAFLLISLLVAMAAAIGVYTFYSVGTGLDLITESKLPALIAARDFSRKSEYIVAAGPAISAAGTVDDIEKATARALGESAEVRQIIARLQRANVNPAVLGRIGEDATKLQDNLSLLKNSALARLSTQSTRKALIDYVFFAYREFDLIWEPGFADVRDRIAASPPSTAPTSSPSDRLQAESAGQAFARLLSLEQIRRDIGAVFELIIRAAETNDPAELAEIENQASDAIGSIEQRVSAIDPDLSKQLDQPISRLHRAVVGDTNIFKVKRLETDAVAQSRRLIVDNADLSARLHAAVTDLVNQSSDEISGASVNAKELLQLNSTVLRGVTALAILLSLLIVWLYVGRNIVARLAQLSNAMIAIADGARNTVVQTSGTDEIGIMGRAVEVFRKNAIELDRLLAERAEAASRLEKLVEERTAELRQRRDELARSVEELRALGEVSQAVNSTLDLGTVLSTIVAKAVQLSGTEAGAIYVFDDQQREFHLRSTYGMDQELIDALARQHIGFEEPNVELVFAQGEPIQVADLRADAPSAANEIVLRAGYRARLVAPLLRGEDVVGMLVVRRKTPGAFPQNTVDLIKTFAAQSVLAIQNARLFDSVETRTRELAKSLEDLRTAQDRLIQTEKLASLGQLTAGIAHEIKNPLNFVNNFSAVSVELIDELREGLAGAHLDNKLRAEISEIADTLQANLDKVVQHGKRADAIVKNMLLHSRQASGERRPVDINALVDESLNLAYHGARAEKQGFNITLERSFDPAAGEVDLFPQEITRVLLNLISNGFYAATKRKAETDGGDYEPALAAATKNLGDSVEIRIRDNGTGIPPEVKEKLFNPFFTTKPAGEGTGLGLSISHDIIVKQHSGSIEVDTQPGEFTEFRIVLPRAAASANKPGGGA